MRTPTRAHTTIHTVPYRLSKPVYFLAHAAVLVGFAVAFNVLIVRLWESDGWPVLAYDLGIMLSWLASFMAAGCLDDYSPYRKGDMA